MTLYQRLKEDLKKSQLGKDELGVSALRMVLAAINNKEIEKRTKLVKSTPLEKLAQVSQLTEEEVIEVLGSEAKKRQEAIVGFKQGARLELAEKEAKELVIIENYLPAALSKEKLEAMIKEVIEEIKASSVADIGKVMAQLMPRIKKAGRADGNLVNQLTKEFLTPKQ